MFRMISNLPITWNCSNTTKILAVAKLPEVRWPTPAPTSFFRYPVSLDLERIEGNGTNVEVSPSQCRKRFTAVFSRNEKLEIRCD